MKPMVHYRQLFVITIFCCKPVEAWNIIRHILNFEKFVIVSVGQIESVK